MATFFFFLSQLFGGQLFELFARETNLKKQSSVRLSGFSDVAAQSKIYQHFLLRKKGKFNALSM